MMRKEFEAFCREHNLICEGERNKKLGYPYAETEIAWKAYRAGALAMRERAAVAAEGEHLGCPTDSESDGAYDRAIDHAADAIRQLPVEE